MSDSDSDETLVWNLEDSDSDDKQLKQLFEEQLGCATESVLQVNQTKDNKKVKRFILHSQGFFDLQAYVVSASDLPQSDSAFEELMPKDKCKKLTNIDPMIYGQTKTAMTGVATSCATFAANGMSKIVTSASLTITYCKEALDTLELDKETSVRHNLDILMMDKYEKAENWDQDFQDARETAQASLQNLAKKANLKKTQVDEICTALTKFKAETMNFKVKVDFLRQQYINGPVENKDRTITTPYTTYLNAELQKSINDAKRYIEEAKEEADKRSMGIWVGVITLVIPPIGVIGITAAILSYDTVQEKINDLNRKAEEARKNETEITTLIEKVNLLTNQFEDIGNKMESAIDALNELSKLFYNQFETYDSLAMYLEDLKNAASKYAALRLRKRFIIKHLGNAVTAFKDLQETAEEFKETVLSQTDLSTWRVKDKKAQDDARQKKQIDNKT